MHSTTQLATEVQVTSLPLPTRAAHFDASWHTKLQSSPHNTPQVGIDPQVKLQPVPHDCEHALPIE